MEWILVRRELWRLFPAAKPLWSAKACFRFALAAACRRGPEAPAKQLNKKAGASCFAKALRNANFRKGKAASGRRSPKRLGAAKAKAAASQPHSKAASPQGGPPYLRNYRMSPNFVHPPTLRCKLSFGQSGSTGTGKEETPPGPFFSPVVSFACVPTPRVFTGG